MNVLPQQRPSLLDRRASNNMPDLPDHLSMADLFSHTPRPSPSSSALRQLHNPRRPSAGLLSFIPLTPIMASPLLTPDVIHAPTPAAVLESAARQRVPGHGHLEDDYITHHASPPNPVWTTSPPTPPPKTSSPPRVAPSTPHSPARAMRHRSKTRSWNAHPYRPSPRPASVAYFTPSAPFASSAAAAPSVPTNVPAQTERVPVRRMSLPSDLSKPLPRVPGPSTDGALKDLPPVPVRCGGAPINTDMAQTLLPSLTSRAPTSANTKASTGPQAGETSTLRVVGKKLFNLAMDEGDQSDEEEPEQRAYKEQSRPTREHLDLEPDMGQTRVRELEKEKAERLRRYHALMELLTTEVGYLLDLRALVTVYLDQLVFLSSIPTTPTPTGSSLSCISPLGPPICIGVVPPRSMSSFSALFPNSRSPPNASESPISTSQEISGSQDRDRQPSGSSDTTTRDRERDKENLDRLLPLKTGKTSGPVLIEREVRAVCRNAQELLNFHERFVCELRDAVAVLGFQAVFAQPVEEYPEQRGSEESMTERLERAVAVVAAKFVNEAASFDIYESFCPGHAAATDLVRRAQERWPSAWDAYEQRCAQLASQATPNLREEDSPELEISSPTSPASEVEDASEEQSAPLRMRGNSVPAPSFVFPASPSSISSSRSQLPFPINASSATSSPSSGERGTPRSKSKLKFMDFLIKPVQRICKYPLLLDQLLDKRQKCSPSQADPVDERLGEAVRKAREAMREVVSRVNRASEKEAHNLRSALIASRIAFSHAFPNAASSANPAVTSAVAASTSSSSEGASSSSHGHSNSISSCSGFSTAPTSPGSAPIPLVAPSTRASALTADFVSSLGPCMLAGALDVVHHPSHRAKYLGAFLYAGGYCILAKITKGGRVYEPRHWFSFNEVEVVDIEEDDAALPFSFRISGYGHHLELAASCTQEKSIWMTTINDSLSVKSSWKSEPLSSFQADDKTPPSAPLVEEPQEFPNGLPTIQCLSDLEKQPHIDENDGSVNSTASRLKYSKTVSRLDGLALKYDPHSQPSTFSALSRRSSTASVKAFFSPMSFDSTRIQRVSSQYRSQVDHGLHDIFSESCLAARAQAQMRGDDLFQVRTPGSAGGRRQGSGMSRSNSGLSIASAMGFTAAKRKYDMVSRRNRSVDLDIPMPPLPPLPAPSELGGPSGDTSAAASSGLTMRAKSLASRRHKKQPPSIAPAISTAIAQMDAERGGQTNVRSSQALSLDSPPDASRCSSVSSIFPSPVDNLPLPIPVPGVSPNGTLRQSDVSPARGLDPQPKRARSMVENVRSFFQPPRADSPTPTASSSSDPDRASLTHALSVDGPPPEHSNTIVQWLRRTSLRRRPGPSSYPSSASVSTDDSSLSENRRPLPTRNSTDGVAPRNSEFQFLNPHSSPAPRRAGFDGAGPKRHRSLFVPSTRAREFGFLPASHSRESTRQEEVEPPILIAPTRSLSARKSLKNVLLFHRSSAMTPINSRAT
ncbi:hypothetical protein C8Q80DRAFT_1268399 [Daedaleopsis nitida]|nr:hypothetical protein C8Q80DRAFT_1268399 [Daedaleopsis nitida]